MSGITGVVDFLGLLNTKGVELSVTVRELREALQDGILAKAPTDTFLHAKKAKEAREASSPLIGPLTKDQELVQTIRQVARAASEKLEAHRWNEAFLQELGEMNQTSQPFTEKKIDSFQVLQIKKLINGLYHLELGLKAIEAEERTSVLGTLAWLLGAESADTIRHTRGMLGRSYDGLNLPYGIYKIVHHIHAACDLFTHIEPEFLSAFGPEFAWVSQYIDSAKLTEPFGYIKRFISKSSGFDTKIAYFLGVLLDQLRSNETGGADFSLLLQLAAVFGESANEKTKDMQETFSDSSQILAKLKSWVVGHDGKSELFDKFEELVTDEIRQRPSEEKRRLDELNYTAEKLKRAFGRVSGNGWLLPLDMVHYASIAWYASSLVNDMGKRATNLNSASQQAIREIVVIVRDKCLAELTGFVDKTEEASLSETEKVSGPFIAELDKQYKAWVEENRFAGLDSLGPLQSEAFTKKRLALAKVRRLQYMQELYHVEAVLKPALECLTKSNPTDAEKAQMISMFKALQPHIEAVDAGFSNKVLQRLDAVISASNYPVISTYMYPIGDGSEVAAIKVRLERVAKSKALALQLNKDLIEKSIFRQAPSLREPLKTVLTDAEKQQCELDGLPNCTLEELKPAPQRRVDKYLLWDNAEGVAADGTPDVSQDAVVKKAEKLLDEACRNIVIDPEGKQDSELSLAHVAGTLQELKGALQSLQTLTGASAREPVTNFWVYKLPYVINTLGVIDSFTKVWTTFEPFAMAAYSAYESGKTKFEEAYTVQSKHYQAPKDTSSLADWAYSTMHAALTAPAHFKALAKGQPEIPESGKKSAERKARTFSGEVGRLADHANASWWFVRYPLLAYDAGRLLWKRMRNEDTIDKQAVRAINNFSHAAYHGMIDHGLKGLNSSAFHQLLCMADDAERELQLLPGTLSLPLEAKIDSYVKAFLDPLSVPSETYFEVRVNEASYQARAARMPHGSSHSAFFDKRLNHESLIAKRKAMAREEAVDRALDLELMRIQKSEKFELKYANKLYLKALREQLRPVVQRRTFGTGGFEDRVFDVMYKEKINDLSLYDRGQEKGSCRLDAMQKSIAELESYLKPTYREKHGFLFSLFEDRETHGKKLQWVKKLRRLVDDNNRMPSVRIQALQAVLDDPVFQKDMNTYSNWLSFSGLIRSVLWLLSCVQLCSYGTAGRFAVDSMVHATDLTVSELQIFDELYAEDYRQLDAMLKQVKALEHYLHSKLDERQVSRRKLFEDMISFAKKREWVKKLRDIAEDTNQSPETRIHAMKKVIADPKFGTEMLACGAIDNCFTFQAFKRGVLWLLSLVGLYAMPGHAEHRALVRAANPYTSYSKSSLIDVGLFRKSAPSTDRNYTAESACEKLGFAPAA